MAQRLLIEDKQQEPRMRYVRTATIWQTLVLMSANFIVFPVAAQPAAEFYAAKPQIRLIVSSTPGGGYDLIARLAARSLSANLPGNPQIVVQNMPGGGGITATNYLYNVAPKDGTVLGLIDRGMPTAELLYGKDSKAQYDIQKFNWIGSLSKEVGVGLVSQRAPARTLDDMKKREVVFGSNGPETDTAMYARLMNSLVGTKIKGVAGYPGQTEYYMAMSRGETDGMFMSGWSGPNRITALNDIAAGNVSYFVQMVAKPVPELGDTPTIMDIVKDPKDRLVVEILLSRLELGRPFLLPPGVPADRVAVLRQAFQKMTQDSELAAALDKGGIKIDPVSGEDAEATIIRLYKTPADVLERLQSIVRLPK
jgi:tripartite-type tricarboxylate transporter receptor subunit TctC